MIKSCYANLNTGKTKPWDKNHLLAYKMQWHQQHLSGAFGTCLFTLGFIFSRSVFLSVHMGLCDFKGWAQRSQCWLLCRWALPLRRWPLNLCFWAASLWRQCLLILVLIPHGIRMLHWAHCRVPKYRQELCVLFWGGETKLPNFTFCCLQESYLVLTVLPWWGSKPAKNYMMGLLQHPRNNR